MTNTNSTPYQTVTNIKLLTAHNNLRMSLDLQTTQYIVEEQRDGKFFYNTFYCVLEATEFYKTKLQKNNNI